MDYPPLAPQHTWLKQLVGDWTLTSTYTTPDASTQTTTAKESVRMIGDYFAVATLKGDMPGCDRPVETILTLGYNPDTSKFVGTWIGSPMPNLIHYSGTLSDDQSTLTLDCTAPDIQDPTKDAQYQDIIVIKSANERELHSQIRNTDGSWTRFNSCIYTRT